MVAVGKWVMLPVAVSFLALIVLRRVLGFCRGLALDITTRGRELHRVITYWPLRELVNEFLNLAQASWIRKKWCRARLNNIALATSGRPIQPAKLWATYAIAATPTVLLGFSWALSRNGPRSELRYEGLKRKKIHVWPSNYSAETSRRQPI